MAFIAGVFYASQARAAIPAEERAALIALYNATDGPHWFNSYKWTNDCYSGDDGFCQPGDEQYWYGITVEANHVVKINLPSNGLKGAIPTELADLSNLRELDLSGNQLSGNLPPELAGLSQLTSLILYNNYLTGPAPSFLSDMDGLVHLCLFGNLFSGPLPPEWGQLANLQQLALQSNRFSGPIPPQWGELLNLTYLDVGYNRLTGPIPRELGNFTQLEQLHLEHNQLSGGLPQTLQHLGNLHYLYLNDNQLCGAIPASITGVPLSNKGSDFRGNHLFTHDEAVRTFIISKQMFSDWETSQTPCPYLGDMNGDALADLGDLAGAFQVLAGARKDPLDLGVADASGDGKVGFEDAGLLLQSLALGPQIGPVGDWEISEGQVLTFTVPVVGQGDGNVVFQMTGLPPSASLDESSGCFHWAPTGWEGGVYEAIIYATDEAGRSGAASAAITVVEAALEEHWRLEDTRDTDPNPKYFSMNLTLKLGTQDQMTADAQWTLFTTFTYWIYPVNVTLEGSCENTPVQILPDGTIASLSFYAVGSLTASPNIANLPSELAHTLHLDNVAFSGGVGQGNWSVDLPEDQDFLEGGLKGAWNGILVSGSGITP